MNNPSVLSSSSSKGAGDTTSVMRKSGSNPELTRTDRSSSSSGSSGTTDDNGSVASTPLLPSSSMRRNVSFAKVRVRQYGQTLGDQPCNAGPPVALDWDFNEAPDEDVDEYEASREGLRRQGQAMKMPPSVRVERLMDHGHTRNQIQNTTQSSRKTMKERQQSARESEAHFKAAQALESLGRKVKRVMKGKKDKERQNNSVWKNFSSSDAAHYNNYLDKRRGNNAFRASDPGMRRVQSMGDALLLSSGGRSRSLTYEGSIFAQQQQQQPSSQLKGILKHKHSASENNLKQMPKRQQRQQHHQEAEAERHSDTEESSSDDTPPPTTLRRTVSLDDPVVSQVNGNDENHNKKEQQEQHDKSNSKPPVMLRTGPSSTNVTAATSSSSMNEAESSSDDGGLFF